MKPQPAHLSPRDTLLWILGPLLVTFALMRLYLHLVQVQHVYPGGYLVHHLFTGCMVVLPAAFVLAFGPRSLLSAVLARVALGIGSALILDEMVFLIATGASDADYTSAASLHGALVFLALGIALLLFVYKLRKRTPLTVEVP